MLKPRNLNYENSFSQVLKNTYNDGPSKNYSLLARAGFVHQEMAGIFTLLPLGQKVVNNIEEIIRECMNDLGAQEITMPAMQPRRNWEKTGRWNTVDVLFKTKSRWSNKEYALGPTHEEIVTPLAKERISSYHDLPMSVYQIQTKFRDEKRAKSGIIRGREFLMKDMYSFHKSEEDLRNFYDQVISAYLKIFHLCGIDAKVTEASGGDFTNKFSHEFMAISPAGEDTIIYCSQCTYAQNIEIANIDNNGTCPKCKKVLKKDKAIEIGNIFDLGRKFTDTFGVTFIDKQGQKNPVYMGCYGIGITRLLGTIVELHHDERGIIWPVEVSPYDIHLVVLNVEDITVLNATTALLDGINRRGYSAFIDDRKDATAGEKFGIADAVGIPVRIVISAKTVMKKNIEVKKRVSSNQIYMSLVRFLETLDKKVD